MSASPAFTGTPLHKAALLTLADASRTAPVNFGTIAQPGANGGLIERIQSIPVGNVTASVLRIFHWDGAVANLLFEVALQAQTLAAGTPVSPLIFSAVKYPDRFPIVLGPNHELRATVNDAQTGIKVSAQGGAF